MAKHTMQHHKAAVRHGRAVPRHLAKRIAMRKAAATKAATVAVLLEPGPTVIEVVEFDFVDPDVIPYEEAAVTSFDDEDL
jgi:hypothetical protein